MTDKGEEREGEERRGEEGQANYLAPCHLKKGERNRER